MKIDFILPSRKEVTVGWRYLAFELVILGSLISFLFQLLKIPVTGVTLNFTFFAVNFLATVLIFRRFLLDSVRHVLKHALQVLLVAIAGFVVYQASSTGLNLLILMLKPDFANINDQSLIATFSGNFILMAVGTAFLVPAAEELLLRGAVFGGLYARSPLAAWLVSVCLFSLMHISSYIGRTDPVTLLLCFVQYIPAGICLAGSYRLSGSILAPIAIHTAVNTLGIFAFR